MVKGHGALVSEEDLPFIEPDGVFCGARRREKCLRQRFWERAAGHCYLEGVMAVEASCLAGNDIGSEGGGQRIHRGECEEVWLSCHLDDEIGDERWLRVWLGAFRSAIDSWVICLSRFQAGNQRLRLGFNGNKGEVHRMERSEGEAMSYF